MKKIMNFIKVIDYHTIIVTALAVGSTYLCRRYQLAANIPTGLIGIAIVFPIVFSINAAYRRREEALKYFASLKAHAVAVCFAHRDWIPDKDKQTEHFSRSQRLYRNLLEALNGYFTAPPEMEKEMFKRVFKIFSGYSHSIEELRRAGMAGNEVSRANQYVRAMMIEFERMKNIQAYRTPISLRAYSFIFLNSFPILFGPYFAYLAEQYNSIAGYAVAVMYSIVLVSLDNIQEGLENPYDLTGADDIRLDESDDSLPLLPEI